MLDAALAAWRDHPTPARAALVVRAGRLAGMDREAITGTDHAELQTAWLAVEKRRDPADLDRLLAILTAGRCEAATARLGKLANQPRDPRIVEKLVAAIEGDPGVQVGSTPLPFTSDANRKFWTAMLAIVADQGDASLAPRLRAAATRKAPTAFLVWLAAKLGKIATAFDARPVPPTSSTQAAAIDKLAAELARAEAMTRPSADTADALYDAVWAAPDDDAPRLVLADFLSARGDPRGEFIALQLARHAGTLEAAGKKREKELLKRHKKQWLGPIAPLVQPHAMRFERGFLVTCQLEPDAEREKMLGDHPAWSTIREYLVHGYSRTARTHEKLVAMLGKHGAKHVVGKWKRGID